MHLLVAVRREPATVDEGDAPTFDLQHDHPMTRMEDEEVCLSVPLPPAAHRLTAHLVKDVPLVLEQFEGLPDPEFRRWGASRWDRGMERRH
jgi:hypothetical protein